MLSSLTFPFDIQICMEFETETVTKPNMCVIISINHSANNTILQIKIVHSNS